MKIHVQDDNLNISILKEYPCFTRYVAVSVRLVWFAIAIARFGQDPSSILVVQFGRDWPSVVRFGRDCLSAVRDKTGISIRNSAKLSSVEISIVSRGFPHGMGICDYPCKN